MATRKLEVEIIGDSRSLERAMGKSGKASDSFGSKIKGMSKMAALGAGAAGVGALVVGLKSTIDAAKDAQAAQERLKQSLASANISYKQHGKAIDAAIQKTSQLAALDDEDLSDAFAKLVRTTGNVEDATNGMSLAAEIARGRNISLEAATKAVEKGFMGSATALKKFGVAMAPVTTQQDAMKSKIDALKESMKGMEGQELDLATVRLRGLEYQKASAKELDKEATGRAAIAKATEMYAGSAEKYGKTAAGAQEALSVSLENLQETIGQRLLPVFTQLMVKLNEAVMWVNLHWPEIEKTFSESMTKIKAIFAAIEPILKLFFDAFLHLAKLVRAIIDGDWSEAWKQFKALAVSEIKALLIYATTVPKLLGEAMLKLAEAGTSAFMGEIKKLPGLLGDALMALPGVILGLYKSAFGAALGLGQQILHGLVRGVQGAASAVGGAVSDAVRAAVNSLIDQINSALSFSFDTHIPGVGKISVDAPDIGHLARGGIVTRPTLAMIGEGGSPEAVIPLNSSRAQGMMGGGGITVNVYGSVTSERDLVLAIRDGLNRMGRWNGGGMLPSA